jgi:hypothetical protein
VIPLIFFPAAYYLTHADIRFRHPIDPLLVIFAAYGAIALTSKNRAGPEQDTTFSALEESVRS